jgi:Asp-tRNA(Asn)/Glu-tRNA(Gln) amidotransferase A subunit family amidase
MNAAAEAMTGDKDDKKFEIVEATIEDIHNAIKSGELTATELVHMYLERIKAYNGVCVGEPEGILGPVSTIPNADQINALSTLNLRPEHREEWGFDDRKARSMTDLEDDDPNMPDALETAAELDAYFAETGKLKGPLHGVVLAIKDQYDTFDMRTTSGGDAAYANDRPPDDATFIAKLREAGAIILAKSNMGEYASGIRSAFGGTFCNPYDTERSPGSSSGGSGSSVAANLVTCAIGEESGRSITNPSAYNNIAGIAPPVELVSRDGMIGAQPFINDRVGPMCRTVEDVARILTVMVGYDPKDAITALSIGRLPQEPYENFANVDMKNSLEGIRIGVAREYMDKSLFTQADHETIDIIDRAVDDLRELGAEIVDPGDGGALFQECVEKYTPSVDNELFIRQFPDLFPVDANGNPTADHIPLLVDMFFDQSLFPDGPTMRDLGPAPTTGVTKYKLNLYLQERGDPNIRNIQDLIDKSNFYNDTNFSDEKEGLISNNSELTLSTINTQARHLTLQLIALQCWAQLDLDAVVHPTSNVPPQILTNPAEPSMSGRSGGSVWNVLPGGAGFPVMSVPAGFTTEVFDRVRDPDAPGGTRLVGPVAAELPVGMSILVKPFDEPTLFKVASAYEAATHHRIPPSDFSGPLPDDGSFPVEHMSNSTASAGYGVYFQKPARVEYVTEDSELVDDMIDSITLKMKRVGTINGTAEIGVLNEDLSIKKLFGTLDVTTLTPTYTDYEFLADELYTIEAGDRIGIKYEGGSLESTSWISVMLDLDAADPFDGANSYLQYHYQGAWRNSPDRDLYMTLVQTHG